jgi:ATP-dependent RNA helicase RhlB
VIIATPGRLIDYVKQHKVVSLHACEVCVLDEADRMFDLGFIKDIRFLLRRMPERTERQTLLFSATLSHRVLELAYEHMNEPEKLVVETEFITAAKVRQLVYYPADEEKLPLLLGLLSRSEGARTMVFVNTKAFVERVARGLDRTGRLPGRRAQRRRAAEEARIAAEEVPGRPAGTAGGHRRGRARPAHRRRQPRLQLRPAVRCRGLRAPHRPHRPPGRGRRRDQLRLRALRDVAADIEAYIDQKIPVEHVTPEMLVAARVRRASHASRATWRPLPR